ncbi:MAG: YiiD C-terminal domain-containing protein [Rhodanobacteraceae bacterium]
MDANASAAATLQDEILARMPLADAMDIRVSRYTGDEIVMTAPLAPNVNDKGCAFGGSMVSLLTLAGWGLIELNLRTRGLDCDIYVGGSTVRYRQPVWGELRGSARFAEAGVLDRLLAGLRERGKGRVDVICELAGDGRPAVELEGRFFAKARA